jgi:TetR/AcrR family transcriptional repressor of nem operon
MALTAYRLVGMFLCMTNAHSSKTRFLDAAMQVIRSKGYAATTVDDLCEAAQLTKGSFFHHFSSKEQLALEAAQHFAEMADGLFEASAYRTLADPLDRVLGYVDLRIAILRGDLPAFTCLLGTMVQETYSEHPAIREACERYIDEHAATVEVDIAAAMRTYRVKADWTAQSLALHTQAVIQGAFVLAKAKGGPEVAAECLQHLRRYIEFVFQQPKRKGSTQHG